jgi:hypothetical protein
LELDRCLELLLILTTYSYSIFYFAHLMEGKRLSLKYIFFCFFRKSLKIVKHDLKENVEVFKSRNLHSLPQPPTNRHRHLAPLSPSPITDLINQGQRSVIGHVSIGTRGELRRHRNHHTPSQTL